jgi:hypothetical protein
MTLIMIEFDKAIRGAGKTFKEGDSASSKVAGDPTTPDFGCSCFLYSKTYPRSIYQFQLLQHVQTSDVHTLLEALS